LKEVFSSTLKVPKPCPDSISKNYFNFQPGICDLLHQTSHTHTRILQQYSSQGVQHAAIALVLNLWHMAMAPTRFMETLHKTVSTHKDSTTAHTPLLKATALDHHQPQPSAAAHLHHCPVRDNTSSSYPTTSKSCIHHASTMVYKVSI